MSLNRTEMQYIWAKLERLVERELTVTGQWPTVVADMHNVAWYSRVNSQWGQLSGKQ